MNRHSNESHCRPVHIGAGEEARRPGLLALLAAGLVALTATIAHGQDLTDRGLTGFVYTADERGNSITGIDLAAGTAETVSIDISPHNVQITADGTRLLAVGNPAAEGHGHGDPQEGHSDVEAAGRLLVLDPGNLSAGPIAEMDVGKHPAHVVVDPEGRRAFVSNASDDTLTAVDLLERTVIGTVAVGDYPHGLRMSPDGLEIYVANVEDGSLSVVDTARLLETARIPVGKAPVQVGFTPDGSRVYASLRDENRVAVVDTAARTVIAKIEVGRNPIQVHATPDGRFVYVANQGTEAEPADTVSVIGVAAGKVVDTIRTGRGAHGVSVSDDGAFVFVSNIIDATVSVIDTATRKVVTVFGVGTGPNGITFRTGIAEAPDHNVHHPAETAGSAKASPAAQESAGGTPGMATMSPEMMKMMAGMMQGMMTMQGGAPGQPGMMRCPMMGAAIAGPQAMGGTDLGPDELYGMPPNAQEEMTPERVRDWLEERLARHGNSRLRIGEIAPAGTETVIAEIVTVDGSLVQKLAFNRHPGLVRQLSE